MQVRFSPDDLARIRDLAAVLRLTPSQVVRVGAMAYVDSKLAEVALADGDTGAGA